MIAGLKLRWQLLAVLTLLLLLAFVGSAIAAPAAMESYLVSQLDARIRQTNVGAIRALGVDPPPRGPVTQVLPSEFVVRMYRPDGTPVGAALRSPGDATSEPALPTLATVAVGVPFTTGSTRDGDQDWRVVVQRDRETGLYLVIAANLANVQSTVAQSRRDILVIGGFALVVLVGLGYLLVRRSFRPLEQVEQVAGEIAAGDLTRRVRVDAPNTEVGRLGTALNTMLGQIESAFRDREKSEATARDSEDRMRRFVADASHELRSPLTSIRGYAELYRQGAVTTEADLTRSIGRIEAEAARMGRLVEDLLLLTGLDQQRPVHRTPVDLTVLVIDAVNDARAMSPARPFTLAIREPTNPPKAPESGQNPTHPQATPPHEHPAPKPAPTSANVKESPTPKPIFDPAAPLPQPPPHPGGSSLCQPTGFTRPGASERSSLWTTSEACGQFVVHGDEGSLRQVLANLLGNAVAHTPPGTPVDVTMTEDDGWAVIEVRDHGPGLTKQQRERVFERFYRVSTARSRDAGGAGLGLSIVAALVEAHGGYVEVDSEPGNGATFRVELPLTRE